MSELTIVMYHYVRPLARSRFPAIKGLDLALFDEQLEYLSRHYSVVSMDMLLEALDGRSDLPPRSVLLTFDDGYADHYSYVFPRLAQRGWSAAFFPPSSAVLDRRVLDVNKIHFLLASNAETAHLVDSIDSACRERAKEFGLAEIAQYRAKHWEPNRFDPEPINYIKRMLQVELPLRLRSEITEQLFSRFVSADEKAFAEELYVSVEQLRLMVGSGMHVGSHGDSHFWLGHMAKEDQERDLDRSLELLAAVGMDKSLRTLCYPFGSFDQQTLDLLPAKGFRAAVTTEVRLADVAASQRYLLPRLDTNHLPKDRHAPRIA